LAHFQLPTRKDRQIMNPQMLIGLGEAIDKITNADIGARGVVGALYDAARSQAGGPMALRAAQMLADRTETGGCAIIATGWVNRPQISPSIAENDGPVGAATLARALSVGLKVAPLILIEKQLVSPMKAVANAAGLCVLPRDEVRDCHKHAPFPVASCAIESFPVEPESAERAAVRLVAETEVQAFIAVERGSCSERGHIHMSSGRSTTAFSAKTDFVLDQVKASGGVTIGIGDGGNELGMGNIRDEIMELMPRFRKCICGCESSVVPVRTVDLLVLATVSNWGAYAIEAALAGLLGKPGIMHDSSVERSVLHGAAQAGLIDGMSGICAPSVDGLSEEVNCSIVQLLRASVAAHLEKQ
jgi:hypothetical protein